MKTGANTTDVKDIKDMYFQGMEAKQISEILKINLKTIESFEPEKVKETKKKSAKKKKQLDDDHHEIMQEKKKHKQEEAELASAGA